jgi:hypothetical protein
MRKGIKHIALVFGYFASGPLAFSQPGINGPICVLPGVIYQYTTADASVSTRQINMQICIRGGSIVDRDGNKLTNCTKSTEPLATVLVMWDDATTLGSITISTSEGNKAININITSALDAGLLDSSSKEQNFSDTSGIPSAINCSPAKGGSCSPNYVYQWQQSNDAMVWTDIRGSTGQNLSFTVPITQSLFYRRKITETNSGTIGYSDVAVINVLPMVQSDTSGIVGFTDIPFRNEYHRLGYDFFDDRVPLIWDNENVSKTRYHLLNEMIGHNGETNELNNQTERF